jgi:hypothetical protein
LKLITVDNVTEYGHTINTLKRFNLYPEVPRRRAHTSQAQVFLAAAYRQYRALASVMNWRIDRCYEVNRGANLSPVQSCEGMGNVAYFYVNIVFALSGCVAGLLFLYGVAVRYGYARVYDATHCSVTHLPAAA